MPPIRLRRRERKQERLERLSEERLSAERRARERFDRAPFWREDWLRKVEEAIAQGIAVPNPGEISRNRLQIPTLLAAIDEFQFDCAIGGARRDEEKARAKERFFSFRDAFGQWDPKNQRPELWSLTPRSSSSGRTCRPR